MALLVSMPMALFATLAWIVCFQMSVASAGRVQHRAGDELVAGSQDDIQGGELAEDGRRSGLESGHLPFPSMLVSSFQAPQFLGKGSFGQTWSVVDKRPGKPTTDTKVTIKFFYYKHRALVMDRVTGRASEAKGVMVEDYITWQTVLNNGGLLEQTQEARGECEMAQEIHRVNRAGLNDRKAQRIMACFDHNIPHRYGTSGSALMPLFVLLEHCGDQDLGTFVHKLAVTGTYTWDHAFQLYRQILEGLEFLVDFTTPYVHHDLKPGNIVVKDQGKAGFTVHLIDLGATVRATAGAECRQTPATGVFAPREWETQCPSDSTNYERNYVWCEDDPFCAPSFDVYSAANIYIWMLSGKWPALWTSGNGTSYQAGDRLSYDKMRILLSSKNRGGRPVLTKAAENAFPGYPLTRLADMKTESLDYIEQVLQGALSDIAKRRPSAKQQLAAWARSPTGTWEDEDFRALSALMMKADEQEEVRRKRQSGLRKKSQVLEKPTRLYVCPTPHCYRCDDATPTATGTTNSFWCHSYLSSEPRASGLICARGDVMSLNHITTYRYYCFV